LLLDDAANAEQVRWLLPPTGRCAALITCRGLLTDLPGVQHIELGMLDDAEAGELFARIVGVDRVAREPEHTTAILRACGHLPLAIRIAGGKLLGRPAWSLGVLRDRLEDESRRLSELRLGGLGVRASFDLSVRALPSAAIRALHLFGLLGPLTVPGWVIGPLLDRTNADDALEALVDGNLAQLVTTDSIGQPRYRLHDLLRTYAVEAADAIPPAERRDAVSRLLATWLDLTLQAVEALPPSLFHPTPGIAPRRAASADVGRRAVGDPVRWFDVERETLLGAVKLAADWELGDLAWELATAAVPYYDHRVRYEDWQSGHEVALAVVRRAGDVAGEARLLRGIAQVQIYRDDFDNAMANLTRSLDLSHRIGDKLGEGLASGGLATLHRALGRYELALRHATHALELAVAAGDQHTEARLRSGIGAIHVMRGHLPDARVWFDEALGLCRALGDTHREAAVLREASILYARDGDPRRAHRALQRALDIFTELDDEKCVAYTLLVSGRMHARHGDRAHTVSDLERAAGIFHLSGSRTEEAKCRQQLGEFEAEHGDATSARRHLSRALELWRSIGENDHATHVAHTLDRLKP
jgi:tetratricopeptide (TPR) repeat protein